VDEQGLRARSFRAKMRPMAVLLALAVLVWTTQVATLTTASNGSFSRTSSVPSGYSGATTVTASTATATASTSFNVGSSTSPPDCTTDMTQQVLDMIAATGDGGTVSFAAGGCYRIEGTIEFSNRTLTLEGNGATFQSFNAPADQRAMWRAVNSTVVWRDMTLAGSYCCGGTLDESLQHAHGIDLRGTNGEVANVTVQDMAGDGVYFGLGYDDTTASSGSVHDSTLQWVGRNGVSFVAAHDARVDRTRVHLVGVDSVDVEPNISAGPGVQRVTVDSNTITGGYGLYAYSVVMNRPISDVAFTNNTLTGVGLRVGVVNPGAQPYRPQRLTVTGNASNTATNPPALEIHNTDTGTITGNTVPLTGGTMAAVDDSCGVSVSGNQFPGGSAEEVPTAGCAPGSESRRGASSRR
jgi:hypothetical protein